MKALRAEYKKKMQEMLDNEYKLEVYLQKIQYLKKEKDMYTSKYKDELHKVQQKAGLKVSKIFLFYNILQYAFFKPTPYST